MDYKNLYDQEMKAERLQEIKNDWANGDLDLSDVDKLITALEVCKNNLSLALDRGLETQMRLESSDEKLVDAQAELADLYQENAHIRAQLAEAQAEVKETKLKAGEWQRASLKKLKVRCMELEEAVEHWKYEMPELRPEEL